MRVAAILALAFVSCGSLAGASPTPSALATTAAPASASPSTAPPASASPVAAGRDLSAADAQRLVGARVAATLDALKRRDDAGLAAVAHPTKGVRFSPYPYVNVANNVVLTRAELAKAYTDTKVRTWGVTDGRGDPITATFAGYNTNFIFSRDFVNAPKTAYNKTIGSGNSIDNTAQIYPDAILFEAYDPGPDPAMESGRWQCLRLLFENAGGTWYLVGVVHGEWTI